MNKKQPVTYAFIDSQNLNLAIRDQGWKLDFQKFRVYLTDKFRVKKAFLFIGFISTNKWLYSMLQKAGYVLIFKPTLVGKTGETKGNIDAELVLHSMIQFNNYEKAIVVSGDGDFYCLIDFWRKKKKLLHVLIPNPRKYSALLRPFRTKFVYINELKKKLGRENKKRGSILRTKP